MASRQATSVYDAIVAITADYLGPAARRFIDRQVTHHLAKDPANLGRRDLPELIAWLRLSFALLTDNEAIVSEYIQRVRDLARNS